MTKNIKTAAIDWSAIPHTPYEWAVVGGVRVGDGSMLPVGAIAFRDQAFAGHGCPVRILSASATADGRNVWVTVERLHHTTMQPTGHATDVLYSPGHLWSTLDGANHASKERAQGNHRFTAWS